LGGGVAAAATQMARIGGGAKRRSSLHLTAHTTIPDPSSIEEEGRRVISPAPSEYYPALASRLDLHDLVGQRTAVLIGHGDVLAHRETVLAQPVQRLVVGGVAVLVVEEPA
jgi:hypothetical protein